MFIPKIDQETPIRHPELVSGSIFIFRGALKEHDCLVENKVYIPLLLNIGQKIS